MVKVSELEKLSKHLEKLIAKYKKNVNDGDVRRLKETQQAHKAIREVLLNCALKGDLVDMVPVKSGKGIGWEVIESNEKLVRYHGIK